MLDGIKNLFSSSKSGSSWEWPDVTKWAPDTSNWGWPDTSKWPLPDVSKWTLPDTSKIGIPNFVKEISAPDLSSVEVFLWDHKEWVAAAVTTVVSIVVLKKYCDRCTAQKAAALKAQQAAQAAQRERQQQAERQKSDEAARREREAAEARARQAEPLGVAFTKSLHTAVASFTPPPSQQPPPKEAVAFVIDISGSMAPESGTEEELHRLETAKRATNTYVDCAQQVMDRVPGADYQFSVSVFNDKARTEVKPTKLLPKRPDIAKTITTAVSRLTAAGQTDIQAGLDEGVKNITTMVDDRQKFESQKIDSTLMLLSDGGSKLPADKLAESQDALKRRKTRVISLGLPGHDEGPMAAIVTDAKANQKFGTYEEVKDGNQLPARFAQEFRRVYPSFHDLSIASPLPAKAWKVNGKSVERVTNERPPRSFIKVADNVPEGGVELSIEIETSLAASLNDLTLDVHFKDRQGREGHIPLSMECDGRIRPEVHAKVKAATQSAARAAS
jgi:Mg-chelatase subunit ChlD